MRAEAENQPGVAEGAAELVGDGLFGRVDRNDGVAVIAGHRRVGIELIRIIDRPDLHFAGKKGCELEAVIGTPALGVEHQNGDAAPRHLLRHAQAGRPAANDDHRIALLARHRAGQNVAGLDRDRVAQQNAMIGNLHSSVPRRARQQRASAG